MVLKSTLPKEAILVPVRCWGCGAILTYLDVNIDKFVDKDGNEVNSLIDMIPCSKCGEGVRIAVLNLGRIQSDS